MGASAITLALAVAVGSYAQSPGAIQQEELDYQSQNFQKWWGADLIWRFEDLPTEGSVPKYRLPYSGHDYPDKAGGTTAVLRKYDVAFHRGRSVATAYEQHDTTAFTEPTTERRGLLGLWVVRAERTPGWHGHCNGWTAASIRHAEPQRSVVRNGVTFTPADIKGLLAEVYMYSSAEFLGGLDRVVNPGLLHVIIANWVGRGSHPIGMDATIGKEVWNYPIYSFSSSSAKRGENRVEVRMNVGYMRSTNREYQQSPRNGAVKSFHYTLHLNEDGKIVGGEYFRDSAQIDMLWAPLHPEQGGQEGNERGCPDIDVAEVLAMWRESVPEELRMKWFNIDPPPEDQIPIGDDPSLAAAPAEDQDEQAEDEDPAVEASGAAPSTTVEAERTTEEPAASREDENEPEIRPYYPRRGLFGRRR
jgi:hypothetical protein